MTLQSTRKCTFNDSALEVCVVSLLKSFSEGIDYITPLLLNHIKLHANLDVIDVICPHFQCYSGHLKILDFFFLNAMPQIFSFILISDFLCNILPVLLPKYPLLS